MEGITSYKDFNLINESINKIQGRLRLLVLNSWLYEQSLNESFIEAKDYFEGKSGLKSKYAVLFTEAMKVSSINKLIDFEGKYIDNLSKIYSSYKQQDWSKLNDIKFIEELDSFLIDIQDALLNKISEVNNFTIQKQLDRFIKTISLEKLAQMRLDFIEFRSIIIDILEQEVKQPYYLVFGNEIKRIIKSKNISFPEITLDITILESSGCDSI